MPCCAWLDYVHGHIWLDERHSDHLTQNAPLLLICREDTQGGVHHLCHSSAAQSWHAHQVSGSDEDDIDKDSKKQRRKTRLSDVAGRPPGSPARSPAQMQSKAAGSSQPSAIPAVYYSREFPSGDKCQAQAEAMHASRLLAALDI